MESLGLKLLFKTVFCKTQTSLADDKIFKKSIRGAIHMSEGDSFVLEAPVQHGAELLLVLGVELEHGDLLAAVLLDVLQPHQGLELRDGPRGVQVSLGEQQQHWGGLQAGLVQQLCNNKNISQMIMGYDLENCLWLWRP